MTDVGRKEWVRRQVEASPPLGPKTRDELRELLKSPEVKKAEQERSAAALIRQDQERIRAAKRCALYRHYDADGILLYVGISNDPPARSAGHAGKAGWTRFVAEVEATWYDDRETAEDEERQAIKAERPLFNKQHVDYDRSGND